MTRNQTRTCIGKRVTALSIMRLLGLMAATHPVIPLGLLFMRKVQRGLPTRGWIPGNTNSKFSPFPARCNRTWNIGEIPLRISKGAVTTYVVVFASLMGWGGGCVPLPVDRRRLAYAPYCSHKCVGARHGAESAVTLLPPGAWPPRPDQDRQYIGGGRYKQTGGSAYLCSLPCRG